MLTSSFLVDFYEPPLETMVNLLYNLGLHPLPLRAVLLDDASLSQARLVPHIRLAELRLYIVNRPHQAWIEYV